MLPVGELEGSKVGSDVDGLELGNSEGSLEGEELGVTLGNLEGPGLGSLGIEESPPVGSTLRDKMSTSLLK